MTHDEQRQHCIAFFIECNRRFMDNGLQLVILKGTDYSPEPVAMTEVFFTGADLDVDVPQVLWVHVRKHLSAIANYMQGTKLNSEDIRSRLMDVANYMALIDSYIADPVRFLRHLDRLVALQKFPNRPEEEITRLNWWTRKQLVNHGGLIEGVNPLEQV